MTAIFYILCGTYYLAIVSSQDPCTNNRELSEPTRSVEYSLAPTDPDLCDRIITEGWYRIPENGNIPTECPPILRCGSTSPIWLNGTLPTTTGTTVTLSACQRGFIQCCDLSFPIDVHNCGGFNVFRLTATPACPGRYCTVGPPAPCPPGMSSDSGFEPCQRLDISFSVTLNVEPFIPTYEPTSPQNELAFRCNTLMPAKYHGYVFDIAWYINNNQVALKERIPYTSLNTDGILHRLDWDPGRKARIGFRIECAMRARQSAVSVPTPYSTSKEFFAGATIEQTSFSVKAGDKVTIRLKSTVPIACQKIHTRSVCDVRIEMFSFQDEFESAPAHCNESVTEKIEPATCGTIMDGNNWKHYHNITVHTLVDQSSRQSYTCSVNLQAKSFTDNLWLNYKLPEVMIHASSENRPARICYTKNDPHIKTFDRRYYTTHEKGEFVIYKHRKKPIEVNTIHRRYDNPEKWTANCAIAIRAAADVFIIYGCGTPGRWIIKRMNCDNEHQYLDIYQRGKNYEVVLPTGTRILITVNHDWLNIHIHISGSDWEQTDGLCGTYNGNRGDDYTNREGNIVSQDDFVKSWAVPRVHSLYVAKSRKDKLATQVMYCSCFNETLVGSSTPISTKANCQWQESLPLCQPLNWKENKCQIHGKRQTDDDLEIDVPFDVVDFAEGPKEFAWKNGWTEEKAVNACTSYAKQSKLFNICSKLANVHVDFDVNSCVSDIKISGTEEFLSSSLDTMKSSCLNEIRVNTTFWKKKTPKETTTTTGISSRSTKSDRPMTTKPNIQPEVDLHLSSLDLQSLSDAIFDVDCPEDCSNAGTCNQGVCECDEGYTEDDCSVNTRKPPDVFGISEESLCDVIKRPCSSVSLFGTGFYHSDSVMCQIVQAKMQEEDIIPGNFNQTVDGILATFGEVKCPLSEIILYSSQTPNISVFDIYLIAVSFNMIDFSNQSPIIVYDGNCTQCQVKDGKPHCVDKKDICRIDGKCYNKEDGICNVNGNTKMDGGINYIQLWTIGAALGGISIVIIPALLIIKRLQKKRSLSVEQVQLNEH